ncbi:hypothetical protein AVEN_109628-1 [Araneus ventricosus]|uniref:Uncharacterized protein n=1 Tax=Araneus ventricosus TaxID=182803 RepID=A0A4Y2FT64_ARAVE|nr:hypothetical protein AVEN_109628-1 [Araneus ventricosus]
MITPPGTGMCVQAIPNRLIETASQFFLLAHIKLSKISSAVIVDDVRSHHTNSHLSRHLKYRDENLLYKSVTTTTRRPDHSCIIHTLRLAGVTRLWLRLLQATAVPYLSLENAFSSYSLSQFLCVI